MNQAGILSLTRSIRNYFGSQRAGNIDFNLVGRWNDFPLVPFPLHIFFFSVNLDARCCQSVETCFEHSPFTWKEEGIKLQVNQCVTN